MRELVVLSLSLVLSACGVPTESDAGADGSPGCEVDDDCTNGVFCDGMETCQANECRAGDPPCTSDACNESAARCDSACDGESDADGDAHDSVECGGDDCDDDDANRYPGNAEVCDADDHDEDCDDESYGERDADDDGFDDAQCCNGASCGDDCDDARADVHPSEAESCDGRDNDCDGVVDEDLVDGFHPDCDGDGWGVRGSAAMPGCVPPTEDPTCGAGTGAWVGNDRDCDDANPTIPRIEECDGLDDDCDGTIDGAAADAFCDSPERRAPLNAESAVCETAIPACVAASCAGTFADCTSGAGSASPTSTEGRHTRAR